MTKEYDVDENYPFKRDEHGFTYFPEGCTQDEDGLYVLPNGKYLPSGHYLCDDESSLLYEPRQLDPMHQLAASIPDSDEDDDDFDFEDED